MTGKSVAIIGSFRQHYEPVREAWEVFAASSFEITSPLGTPVIEEGIPFVRFESDPQNWDDPTVQTVALHRILRATLVYVVAPEGYVGRTTCYEIGRVIQAHNPIYFSATPKDLPILVPPSHVVSATDLLARLAEEQPRWLYDDISTPFGVLERRLIEGDFIGD